MTQKVFRNIPSVISTVVAKQTILLSFLGILLAMPLTKAAAQDTNPKVSIDVSTQVISTIEMITIQSMDLTNAEQQNNIIRINPQQSANAGKMVAIGTPNSDIRISYLRQRELTRQQGNETLQFRYRVAGNSKDDQSTAEILNHENRDFAFNEEGRFYLWIGGSVDISTASPGNYQGEFTLDIEYI